MPFNRIVIKKGDVKQIVYYWFQQCGRIVANEYLMKWYLFKDALNRSGGALVRITALVKPGEDEQIVDDRIKRFILTVTPLLPNYLPN